MARRAFSKWSQSASFRDKTRFARFTRWIAKLVGSAIGLYFSYYIFKDFPFHKVLTAITSDVPLSADVMWRSALALYWWAWIAGGIFDTNMQEDTYRSFPGKGRWPIAALVALLVIVLLGFLLLISLGNPRQFSMALTVFFIADHGLWFYYRKLMAKSVQISRAEYRREKRFTELEALDSVVQQVFGKWRIYRFLAGALIVALADLFAFFPAFQESSGWVVTKLFGWLSISQGSALFYPVLLVIFVLVMEVSHWVVRAETYFRVRELERLEQLYTFVPRRS